MSMKYSLVVLFSVLTLSDIFAAESKPAFYPNDREQPLPIAKEDYQLSNLSLQGLTGLYINIDDAINSAKPKNIKLPADLKAQLVGRLEKAGMRLLSKEEMEKTPGQPEMSMFPSYPKHLGPFKPGEPRIEYNAQCCTAGIWTSFTQGASTLRNPLLNHKLATWGEGHNTADCADLGKWLAEAVLKTIDHFIVAKQKADQDYKKWFAQQGQVDTKPVVTKAPTVQTKSNLEAPVAAKPGVATPATDKTVEVHAIGKASSLACDTAVLLYAELFPTASATLSRTNIAILAKVADNIKACPQYRYRIETHSDQRADEEYNEVLSARRAVAIRNYLVDHGVDEEQFDLRFYGERKPLVMGDDELAWAANRRVAIMPIKIKTSGF